MGQQRAGLGLFSGRMMKGALGILSQLMGGLAKEMRVPDWAGLRRAQILLEPWGPTRTCLA